MDTEWVNEKINWGEWIEWKERENQPNITKPGIYALSVTKKLKSKKVDFDDIHYIGMTNSKEGLKQRLNQFDTAIKKGHGHSAGNKIFEKEYDFKEANKEYSKWNKEYKLYVAIYPMKDCKTTIKENRTPDDLLIMGKCAYLEYKAMAEYKKEMIKQQKKQMNKNLTLTQNKIKLFNSVLF